MEEHNMGKPRSVAVSDDQIIAAYGRALSLKRTAVALGIGETTVYRVLMKHGIRRTGREMYLRNATLFRGRERQIRRWYEGGMTVSAIIERLGEGTHYSVKQAIKRARGELRLAPNATLKIGEIEKIQRLHDAGLGQGAISLKLGRSQSFISRAMRRAGISTWAGTSGAAHPMWRGGRWKDGGGYWKVLVEDDDPLVAMRQGNGYALEHRYVMAKKLGRVLTSTETVHHIDGDKLNNHPDNLQLRQGRHGKGVILCCLDCGSRNIGPSPIK